MHVIQDHFIKYSIMVDINKFNVSILLTRLTGALHDLLKLDDGNNLK